MVAVEPLSFGSGSAVRASAHGSSADPIVLSSHLQEALLELEHVAAGVASMLTAVMQSQDPETAQHLERVSAYGMRLASVIEPSLTRGPVRFAFLLHDIGKITVPPHVLRKPGPLTSDEWRLVRRHPIAGADLLLHIPAFGEGVELVRAHHERWDGTGYPRGLKGEEIPLAARIFSVVDAYDAMTTDRPYRPARAPEEAVDEIRAHAGSQFDPGVVDAFCDLFPGS